MGAGGSTLTTTDVNNIINNKKFAKESDLGSYAKASDLGSYAKASDLTNYLNKTADKVSETTPKTDTTKWVTPKWVSDNAVAVSTNETSIAQKLADNSSFRNALILPLSESANLQSGIATGLLSSDNKSNFITSLNAEFTGSDQFKNSLAEVLTSNESYRSALRGRDGTFNAATIQRNLWDGTGTGEGKKVMWCADGDLCQVPVGKSGILFTGGDQVLQGSGSVANVNINDNIQLKSGGTIQFARNAGKGEKVAGDIGSTDARILATVVDGTTDTAVKGSSLEIHGVGKLSAAQGATRRKQVKIFDDLEVTGKLKLGSYTFEIEKADDKEHLFIKRDNDTIARFSNDWDRQVIYNTPNDRSKYFYINKEGNFGLIGTPGNVATSNQGRDINVNTLQFNGGSKPWRVFSGSTDNQDLIFQRYNTHWIFDGFSSKTLNRA